MPTVEQLAPFLIQRLGALEFDLAAATWQVGELTRENDALRKRLEEVPDDEDAHAADPATD